MGGHFDCLYMLTAKLRCTSSLWPGHIIVTQRHRNNGHIFSNEQVGTIHDGMGWDGMDDTFVLCFTLMLTISILYKHV
jgi:hypothetical protein